MLAGQNNNKKVMGLLLKVIDGFLFWLNRNIQTIIDSRIFRKAQHWLDTVSIVGYRNLPLSEVLYYFKDGVAQGKVWQRAKGLSYSLLMALPPLAIFLFTLVAYLPVDGLQAELQGQLVNLIPGKFTDRVIYAINDVMGHKHGSLMSIGFVASIVLATNGVYGCLMSMNYANTTVKRRGFFVRYALSMLLVFLLFLLLTAAMSLLVGYKVMLGMLINNGVIAQTKLSMFVFSFGRWIILTFLTLLVLTILYRFAIGDREQRKKLRFMSVGSMIATGLFFVLTWGFQIYLNQFNQFNLLYGSIGTLLMIMLWIFANCYVLLLGYEVNVSVLHSRENASQWILIQQEREERRRVRRLKRLRLASEENVPELVDEEPLKENEVSLTIQMILQQKRGQWVTKSTKIIERN